MSDTTQAVGRITILAAATFVFAVAWRGDESASARPTIPVAWSRRGSEDAGNADGNSPVVTGLRLTGTGAGDQFRIGALMQQAIRSDELAVAAERPLFSGAPAFLGRSTITAIAEAEPRTAVADQAANAIQ